MFDTHVINAIGVADAGEDAKLPSEGLRLVSESAYIDEERERESALELMKRIVDCQGGVLLGPQSERRGTRRPRLPQTGILGRLDDFDKLRRVPQSRLRDDPELKNACNDRGHDNIADDFPLLTLASQCGEGGILVTADLNINRASRRLRALSRPVSVMGPSTFLEWLANNGLPEVQS